MQGKQENFPKLPSFPRPVRGNPALPLLYSTFRELKRAWHRISTDLSRRQGHSFFQDVKCGIIIENTEQRGNYFGKGLHFLEFNNLDWNPGSVSYMQL